MLVRKKRKCLTFGQKSDLLKKVQAGTPKEELAREYGITVSTLYKIAFQEPDVLEKSNNFNTNGRKSRKTSGNLLLDTAMIKWFQQMRDTGSPVTGPFIQEKACIMNELINNSKVFKGSTGWLRNFKKRYNLSNYAGGTEHFSQLLLSKIQLEKLSFENIYNADEAGIYWQTLVTFILTRYIEEESPPSDEIEERVTALFCSNVTGNHRIPLLIVGNSYNPNFDNLNTLKLENKKFKFLEKINSIYTYQSSSWLDEEIFMLWYTDVFIPQVLEYQDRSGITGKVVLILDNAPPHPPVEELNAVHQNFEVLYLPSNVTASTQPLNQGAISLTKKIYKNALLRRLVQDDKEDAAQEFLYNFDIQQCLILLSYAWNSLKSSTLKAVWTSLLGDIVAYVDPNDLNPEVTLCVAEESSDFPYEISDKLSHILSAPGVSIKRSKELFVKWFDTDHDDCGWKPLSDDELVFSVKMAQEKEERLRETEKQKIRKTEQTINNPENTESQQVTLSDALEGLMKFKKWMRTYEKTSMKHYNYVAEYEKLIESCKYI